MGRARSGTPQRPRPPRSVSSVPLPLAREPRFVRSPAVPSPAISDRDIRSKRPPAVSFLLRISTLGRPVRVISLLALDFAAVALAIFTALLLKEAVHGEVDVANSIHGTKQFLPFAYLLTALLFA